MNHNDNTSGYILSNYLSNIFHLHQRRPSSDPEDARTPRDPDGVLSCVMPCRNPDPRPPKRISRPDPNYLTTFSRPSTASPERIWTGSVVLCYV
jgi:hypothetical protein